MRKLCGSAAFLFTVGLMGASHAADLSVVNPAPEPVVEPAFSWTGFYLGVNAGGGFAGDDEVGLSAGETFIGKFGSLEASGFFGGAQLGYNYQLDSNWVIGLETDFQGGKIHDSVTENGLHSSSKVNWYGTLRPRVGYSFDHTLLYGTGGLAYGHVDYKSSVDGVDLIDQDKTRVGWVLGAGLEHAFTDHLTAKLEYQYVNFEDFHARGGDFSSKVTPDFHSVRVGLNYKF
ncbi:outer membrane protein [Rhizobium binxianense]